MKASAAARSATACIACALALGMQRADAQPQVAVPSPHGGTPAAAGGELEPVTVTATRVEQRNFDVPAAVDTVGIDAIRAQQPGVDLSEALDRVPGIQVRNRQNFAQDLQVSSRGFGARASFGVRGVRLLQDGIPLTMPDGQGQTGLFDLDAANRIEVLRGPFAALYGNSSGGLVSVFTEDPPRQPTFVGNAAAGSHRTWKLGGGYGNTIGDVGLRFDASRFATDGYRRHSRAVRNLGSARIAWSGDDDRFALNATALDQPDTQDPLGLTRTQLLDDRRQPGSQALAFDTRKSVDHAQLGAEWERRLAAESTLRVRAYGGERRITQFLAFRGDTPGSSGGVVDLDRGFGGLNLQWSKTARIAGGRFDATIGVDYDRMQERRKGFVNDSGVTGELRRDESDTVRDFDQYALLEWWMLPHWKIAGGVRRSDVRFDIDDDFVHASNPDDSGRLRYRATSPVIGLLHTLGPTTNVYVSMGRGFETPTFSELAYRPDGLPGPNFALKASRSTNYEAGIKWLAGKSTRMNAALFRTTTRQDIVPDVNAGGRTTFRNAARTARHGLELAVESAWGAGFETWFAWTWTCAEFRDYRALDGTDLSGKSLPGVPKASAYAEIVWRHPGSGFVTGLDLRWDDEVPVDDSNSQHADSYLVVDWRAGYTWRVSGWQIEPFVRLDNVFDRRYVGSVIVNAAGGRFYEPAPERSVFAGLRARHRF